MLRSDICPQPETVAQSCHLHATSVHFPHKGDGARFDVYDLDCSRVSLFELVVPKHRADYGTSRDDNGRMSADLLTFDDEGDVSHRLRVQKF
jgi:hypothetical protein